MPLTAGMRLGPYEIVSALGAGGMGEVYQARDARLGRDVAIKVLPSEVATDPDRLRRFEQEARAAAALNHSNILALYDIGSEGGVAFIVTELLEGRTLRHVLEEERLSIARAVDVAAQIADGLAAAHARGIVHRDIKPENIFITADGRAKILDFGLAKSVDAGEAADTPTRSATAPHTVLGTAGYMAPEQVRGQPVDHRADLFAFGTVLYELVTGRRAFTGDTVLDTMSAILREAPATIPSTADRPVPPSLLRIVDRCLEKSPASRFQSTTDLAFALKSLSVAESGATLTMPALAPFTSGAGPWLRAAPWALAAVLAIGLGVVWYSGRGASSAVSPAVIRFTIPEPEGTSFGGAPMAPFAAISPDGEQIVFVTAAVGSQMQLWLRPLRSPDASPLAGTGVFLADNVGGASAPMPFWSPDSRSVGFFSEGKLKRVDLETGVVQTICDAPQNDGATWAADGTIAFSGTDGVLHQVPSRGGTATPITFAEGAGPEAPHILPSFLPGGRRFLFRAPTDGTIWAGSLDGRPPQQVLPATDSAATYAAPGFLLFVRQQVLLAQRFDAERLTVEGDPLPIAVDVRVSVGGRAAFTVSSTGVLVYRTGTLTAPRSLIWMDRNGSEIGTAPDSHARYAGRFRLLEAGRRAIVHIHDPDQNGGDLWSLDLETGARTRITFDPGHDQQPVLSPDGRFVAWESDRQRPPAIFRKPSSGAGAAELWIGTGRRVVPTHWSRRWIVFDAYNPDTDGWDIWFAPVDDPTQARPYLETVFNERNGTLSPDERWMAYESNEGGTPQVFIAAFPDASEFKRPVSSTGHAPGWRNDGREIVFLAGGPLSPRVSAVAIEPGPDGLTPSPARVLFDPRMSPVSPEGGMTPDGQRFLLTSNPELGLRTALPLSVIVNWPALVAGR
jgi:Tol biopolymer transport system component